MALATWETSAPVASHTAEIAFILEILWAKNAFATYNSNFFFTQKVINLYSQFNAYLSFKEINNTRTLYIPVWKVPTTMCSLLLFYQRVSSGCTPSKGPWQLPVLQESVHHLSTPDLGSSNHSLQFLLLKIRGSTRPEEGAKRNVIVLFLAPCQNRKISLQSF